MNTEPRDEWRCPRRDGERCACPGKPHYFTGDELRPRTIYQVRCIGYDCTAPGPVPPSGRACDCPDYEAPRG
jgi:hypothetical protein